MLDWIGKTLSPSHPICCSMLVNSANSKWSNWMAISIFSHTFFLIRSFFFLIFQYHSLFPAFFNQLSNERCVNEMLVECSLIFLVFDFGSRLTLKWHTTEPTTTNKSFDSLWLWEKLIRVLRFELVLDFNLCTNKSIGFGGRLSARRKFIFAPKFLFRYKLIKKAVSFPINQPLWYVSALNVIKNRSQILHLLKDNPIEVMAIRSIFICFFQNGSGVIYLDIKTHKKTFNFI